MFKKLFKFTNCWDERHHNSNYSFHRKLISVFKRLVKSKRKLQELATVLSTFALIINRLRYHTVADAILILVVLIQLYILILDKNRGGEWASHICVRLPQT